MSKLAKLAIAMVTLVALGMLLVSDSREAAQAQDKKKIDPKLVKINPKVLAKILNATDPEIKAVQKALAVALADLNKAQSLINKAMADEVFGEKGATEGAVIDELKLALKSCKNAISDCKLAQKHANIAQFKDKSKD